MEHGKIVESERSYYLPINHPEYTTYFNIIDTVNNLREVLNSLDSLQEIYKSSDLKPAHVINKGISNLSQNYNYSVSLAGKFIYSPVDMRNYLDSLHLINRHEPVYELNKLGLIKLHYTNGEIMTQNGEPINLIMIYNGTIEQQKEYEEYGSDDWGWFANEVQTTIEKNNSENLLFTNLEDVFNKSEILRLKNRMGFDGFGYLLYRPETKSYEFLSHSDPGSILWGIEEFFEYEGHGKFQKEDY